MNRYLAILALSFTAFQPQLGHASPISDAQPARQKVVFQVSDADPGKWGLTLNNVSNLQDALGDRNVDIEVVVYGPGIGMLKMDSPVGDRVNEAEIAGVKIVACQNTMNAKKLTKNDMLGSIGYVPGGVVEILKREGEGWAYIRP